MGHPFGFGSAKREKGDSRSASGMTTKKAMPSATAQWPVDGLRPTLRDEAAKDGAPVWFWQCEEGKGGQ
jgi:hypothetical protein